MDLNKFKTAKIFTTGQVAEIVQVSPRTVCNWFDYGKIKGYRIPGGGDRRIMREHLVAFLEENGMPTIEQFLDRFTVVEETK